MPQPPHGNLNPSRRLIFYASLIAPTGAAYAFKLYPLAVLLSVYPPAVSLFCHALLVLHVSPSNLIFCIGVYNRSYPIGRVSGDRNKPFGHHWPPCMRRSASPQERLPDPGIARSS